jgi:hypothetical protein
VSAPSGFHGFLTSLEALQDHLRQLFDDSKKGRKAYRDAQCFLTELNGGFKRTLGHAKARLGGEYAVELLFHPWENNVMSEDLEYFDPLGLLRTALENNTAAHYKNLQKLQAKASAQRAFASSAAPVLLAMGKLASLRRRRVSTYLEQASISSGTSGRRGASH